MAFQTSTIQIKGRLRGESYYHVKGQKVGLVRTIDPNLRDRVIHNPEYASFRAQGGEFGSIGYFVSQCLDKITNRGKNMLSPYRTADLTKYLLPFLSLDEQNPFGQRSLQNIDFQRSFSERLAKLSKNNPSKLLGNRWNWTIYENLPGQPSSSQFSWEPDVLTLESLRSIGVDSIRWECYRIYGYVPYYLANPAGYTKPTINCEVLGVSEFVIGAQEQYGALHSFPFWGSPELAYYAGVFALFPQRRTPDGSSIVLNQHCSFIVRTVTQS